VVWVVDLGISPFEEWPCLELSLSFDEHSPELQRSWCDELLGHWEAQSTFDLPTADIAVYSK
jgi:hypothetical protein